ncbi:MAG: cyclic nucleotide-binding domain-containing protein [Sedimentisphaerales bacterium]|nr:cyclic nucleotide-binding domain-containing protein [Sedimentisphaerales bacterium]
MISPEVLRRYAYFAPIAEESLKQIAMLAEERVVPAGTVMFYEHDPANTLYVILKGEVDIKYTLGSGEMVTVDTLIDGDLLVWSALVEPHRTSGVGTTTRETRLAAIDAAGLRHLCYEDPQLGFRLMSEIASLLADRLERARTQLAVVDRKPKSLKEAVPAPMGMGRSQAKRSKSNR